MDAKLFKDLQNKGLVTVVGFKAEDFKDIKDLQNKGLITVVGLTETTSTETPETEEDIVVDEENDPTEDDGEVVEGEE